MNKYPVLRNLTVVLGSVALVMAAYKRWLRPYQLHRGATDEEVQRSMPGDELLPNPTYLASRAITIDAMPEEIWPWLIQMGFKRAGFYGYDIIENLGSPRGIQSALTILPEFQHPKIDDEVPISLAGGLKFYAIEPNRYLIWSGDLNNGGYVYTWALYQVDEHHTRLVSRARLNHIWSKPDQLAFGLITEFAEHLGIPKILQGVKGRVEGHNEPMAKANIEVVIYLASAFIYVGSVILTLLHPLTWRRGLAVFAAGAAWLITWYAPVSIWIGALLELLVLWWLRWVFRRDTTPISAPY